MSCNILKTQPGTDTMGIIHGGAWDIPPHLFASHREGLTTAWAVMIEALQGELPLIEVVAHTLQAMEDSGIFDAGYGAFLNAEGQVELDAGIMRGEDLEAGAVACLTGIPWPSQVALQVLQDPRHVLLCGQGANAFARGLGFEERPAEALVSDRELASHRAWLAAGRPDPKIYFAKQEPAYSATPERLGTVGVVVGRRLAENGRWTLAAGTSTGGTPGKAVGRVGDSPLVGAGVYCDDLGAAVSCTGWGEGLLRVVAAKAVSDRCRAGEHPQAAIEEVLQEMELRVGGRGGIIAMDGHGRCGAAFSTPHMAMVGTLAPEAVATR